MTPLQTLVAKHYCGGEFAHVTDPNEYVGDGLFNFVVEEAQDAADIGEFVNMMDTAISQLRDLQTRLLSE